MRPLDWLRLGVSVLGLACLWRYALIPEEGL